MCFSIIIPVYNVVSGLTRAVKSVQEQKFSDWEIVLVDDGSTDGSAAICDKLALSDGRIKVVHKINEGVVSARQRGFEESRGQWVLFLDGDDELNNECLADLAHIVKTSNVEMVQFGYQTVEIDGTVRNRHPGICGIRSFDWVLANSDRSPLQFLGMCIWDKCYRRDLVKIVFEEVGDVRISHSEDGLFAFAAFLHSEGIYFVNECYYKYIQRRDSAVHKFNLNIVTDKQCFINRMELLAKRSGRISYGNMRSIIDFHIYQACCTIFMMLNRNRATKQDILKVLEELNTSGFLKAGNREWNSCKRRLLRMLLRHKLLYIVALRLGLFR